MEHFLEGINALFFRITQRRRVTNKIPEQLLQGNFLVRHLLNEEPQFMSLLRSSLNEVNDGTQTYINYLYS